MIYRTCILMLMSLALCLQALETPLVITTPESRLTGVINPAQGTIQIYEISGERLTKRAATNFLADLEFLKTVPATRGRMDWSRLRPGSASTAPTYAEFFDNIFPKLDARKTPEGMLPFSKRAWNAEEDFWKSNPEYDGKISAAFAGNGLLIVIPSMYTMMFYFVEGFNISLAGHRNYRTELYIPQVYNSSPTPQEILRLLPDDVQEDHRESIQKQMEAMGEAAGEKLELKKSEVWVIAMRKNSTNVFIVLDYANDRLMSYEYLDDSRGGRLLLKSVRNLEVDLLIPSTFNSDPTQVNIVRDHNKWLKRIDEPPVSEAYLRKLAGVRSIDPKNTSTGGNSSDIQANIDNNGKLYLDYPKRRKLFTYDPFGRSDLLELESARDYSLEVAIGIQMKEVRFRAYANEILKEVKRIGSKKNTEQMLTLLEKALVWNPHLYKVLEKDRKTRRYVEDDPRWQEMIDKASEAAQRKDEERTAIEAAIKEEEARRKGR